MMRRTGILAALLLLAGWNSAVQAEDSALTDQQRQTVLAEAQQSYEDGVALLRTDPISARERFRAAAHRFQRLLDEDIENGRLYYNLANAQLQSNDLGLAILNYRRAQRLIPADQRLESNLRGCAR